MITATGATSAGVAVSAFVDLTIYIFICYMIWSVVGPWQFEQVGTC